MNILFKTSIMLVCALTSSLVIAGVKPQPESKSLDQIAVVMNDSIITQKELNSRVEGVVRQMQAGGVEPPRAAVLKRQVIERMILEKLQLKQAEASGIHVDEPAVDEAVSNIAKHNRLTNSELKAAVERDGVPFAKFKSDLKNELIISKLQQREIVPQIHVTEQEIQNLLTMPESTEMMNARYRLSHILVSLPAEPNARDIEQAKSKAEGIYQTLRSGKDFSAIAQNESQDSYALSGGDLGWRTLDELPTLFVNVAPKMKVGQFEGPIRSPNGFHIIKLVDKQVIAEKPPIIQQTKARHILIKTDAITSDENARLRLIELKSQLANGKKFEDLAKMHSSDHASAAKGGDLGWVTKDSLVPEFAEVMDKTKINTISAPFKTPFGWHIVEVTDRRSENNAANLRRERATVTIRGRKFEDKLQSWLQQLRAEAHVEILADLGDQG